MPVQNKPDVNTVWASGGLATPVDQAKQALGFIAEIPDYDMFNGMIQQISAFQKHVNQEGVPRWDAATQYYAGGFTKYNNRIMQAKIDNVNQVPPAAGGENTQWRDVTAGRLLNIRVITANEVYNPSHPLTTSVVFIAQGGGGAGAGAVATAAGQTSMGAGGGGGAFAMGRFTSGFSGITLTVGQGGVGVVGAVGPAGGATTVGALMNCPGGVGGQNAGPSNAPFFVGSSTSGAPTGGNIFQHIGHAASYGTSLNATTLQNGTSGASHFGPGVGVSVGVAGFTATSYGAGGGGTASLPSSAALRGGNGAPGVIIAVEFS